MPVFVHVSLLLSHFCIFCTFHCIVQWLDASNTVSFLFCFSSGDCLKDNSIWSKSPIQACLLSFPLSAKTVNCQVQGSAFSHITLTL